LGRQINTRTAVIGFALPAGVAALLALPSFAAYWRASTLIAAPPPDLLEVNFWGASLNSLPLPYVFHPWLKSFATAIYRGIVREGRPAKSLQWKQGRQKQKTGRISRQIPAGWIERHRREERI
jgi:hypothetical protein